MIDYPIIGKMFVALRKGKNLSQKEFAEKLDISQTQLSKVESGHRMPSIALVGKVGEECHVSIDYILTGEDYKNKKGGLGKIIDKNGKMIQVFGIEPIVAIGSVDSGTISIGNPSNKKLLPKKAFKLLVKISEFCKEKWDRLFLLLVFILRKYWNE